jgi:hypothetical protein
MKPKRRVHKLSLDDSGNFYLIGIASHENDYRISWAMNHSLNWNLAKTDDFRINHPKLKVEVNYSRYHFSDAEGLNFDLISNKSEKGFLLPEYKNIDYILKVSGEDEFHRIADLIRQMKKINIVITAFAIENLTGKMHSMFTF